MAHDEVVDGGDTQLFPEEWRDRLDGKLIDGIVTLCPHCSGNTPAAGGSPSSPVEPITFVLDGPSDADERKRAIDSLLTSGKYVTMLFDDECAVGEKRNEPFFVVLSLGDDGEIHVETLNRKGMAELYVSSTRAAAIAERSAAKVSGMAADVRALLRHTLTSNLGVPEENLGNLSDVELVATLNRCRGDAEDTARTAGMAEGAKTAIGRILSEYWNIPERSLEEVPDANLMGILNDLLGGVAANMDAYIREDEETRARLLTLLGNRAAADDADPDKTSLQELVDRVWATHSEFVEAVAAAIGVNLTQDTAADTKAIFERLRDLASNDPDTIIKIGVALGMDEGDMRRKMLATLATAGDEKAARAELAKSVTDTARVMLARWKYALEAAGLDRHTVGNAGSDPNAAMRALSAIIGENRRVAEVRKEGIRGGR